MGQQPIPTNLEKQLVALGRVLQTLREEENVDVLIETTLNYIKAECEYNLIWIGLYDRLEHRLIGKGGIVPPNTPTHVDLSILKQRFPLAPGDLLEQVVIQQRPVGVPDLRAETRAGEWRKIAQQFQVQGAMVFPIRYRALCYGVAILGSDRWGISPRSDEKARMAMILGELAASLNGIEVNWHRQQSKRPEDPLLALLGKLPTMPTLNQRLDAVVTETHKFIAPTRTNIYWFERERRYFWRRAGNLPKTPGMSEASQAASGITVQEVQSFYQALLADQMVSIGEARSTLKAETTSRLMQLIKARSLLAAPILYQGELLGFLAVEGTEPRIWEEAERNYLRAAAQMVALTSPAETMEMAIASVKADQALTSEIVRGIYTEEDWKVTLNQCAELLCNRLGATRFLVLIYDADYCKFDIAYQNLPAKRRPIAKSLPAPSEVDWNFLERSTTAIAIENWEVDLKLMNWRLIFEDAGVRSLMICNTAIGHSLDGLLLLAYETPRSFNAADLELVQTVSQQIGLILHQWQLHAKTAEAQKMYNNIQWGLTTLQHITDLEQLERTALQQIGQVLQVPLVVLVTWSVGNRSWSLGQGYDAPKFSPGANLPAYTGRLLSWTDGSPQFALSDREPISARQDGLIQATLANDGVLPLKVERLPAQTRAWLNAPGVGEVIAIALRTAPEHEPTGIVLVGDAAGRLWTQRYLDAFGLLVTQLAWSRRNMLLSDLLRSQQEELECLNWYKQRRIEDSYYTLSTEVSKLNQLGTPKDALTVTRYQQGLRQLGNVIGTLAQLLKEEQWRLRSYSRTMPIVSLLKRAFTRVDRFIKERQLWLQVHGETGTMNISGDIFKIELIVYELLVLACQRSPQGGRIDIWCQPQPSTEPQPGFSDNHFLELSITDSGTFDSRLMAELQQGSRSDPLAFSPLNRPPGLNLLICQSLMRHLGGDFKIYQLEDGRVLSRLLLPMKGTSGT